MYPSLYEGFGLPVLEAMACGTPVIVSRHGSIPEIAGDAGLYVDSNNINDMVQVMRELLLNKSLYRTLVIKGLERVDTFSWVKMSQEIFQIYNLTISSK